MTPPLPQELPPYLREPLWRPHRQLPHARLPVRLRPWLLDTGSLTQRLISACAGTFRVQVVRQRHARPMQNETRRLRLRFGERALVREVLLYCGGTPWVYARTVIPQSTLSGRERRLAHLGSRSLGATLFADPSTLRGDIEIVELRPGSRLYETAGRASGVRAPVLWGRRARFTLNGKHLLVSEIFLPALGGFPA
jgi:chorismate lyase